LGLLVSNFALQLWHAVALSCAIRSASVRAIIGRCLHTHNLIDQFRLGENSVEKVFYGKFTRVDFRFNLVICVFGHTMQTEAGYLVAIDDRGVDWWIDIFQQVSLEIANEVKIVFVFVLMFRERQFTLLPFFWIWERDLLRVMYAT